MSRGNPRWIYAEGHGIGFAAAFLAEVHAAADKLSREQEPAIRRSSGSAARGGSGSSSGAGVRVPAARVMRLREVMQRHS